MLVYACMLVCLCVCACVCSRLCVRARVCGCARVCAFLFSRICHGNIIHVTYFYFLCATQSLTLKQAETLALQTLKQEMEEKLSSVNVELASVSARTGLFHAYTKEELDTVIATL